MSYTKALQPVVISNLQFFSSRELFRCMQVVDDTIKNILRFCQFCNENISNHLDLESISKIDDVVQIWRCNTFLRAMNFYF